MSQTVRDEGSEGAHDRLLTDEEREREVARAYELGKEIIAGRSGDTIPFLDLIDVGVCALATAPLGSRWAETLVALLPYVAMESLSGKQTGEDSLVALATLARQTTLGLRIGTWDHMTTTELGEQFFFALGYLNASEKKKKVAITLVADAWEELRFRRGFVRRPSGRAAPSTGEELTEGAKD